MFKHFCNFTDYGVGDYFHEASDFGAEPQGQITTNGDGQKVITGGVFANSPFHYGARFPYLALGAGVVHFKEAIKINSPGVYFTYAWYLLGGAYGGWYVKLVTVAGVNYLRLYKNMNPWLPVLGELNCGPLDGSEHIIEIRMYFDKVYMAYDDLNTTITPAEAERAAMQNGARFHSGACGNYVRLHLAAYYPTDIWTDSGLNFKVDGVGFYGAAVKAWDQASSAPDLDGDTLDDGDFSYIGFESGHTYWVGIVDAFTGFSAFVQYTAP